MATREAAVETPVRTVEGTGARGGRRQEALDSPEARRRSVRRFLDAHTGIRVRLRFLDATGAQHEVCSCPAPGGCFLFDASANWGIRAIGPCGKDDDVEQLAADYAACCSAQDDPFCRELRLSDLRRRPSSAGADSQ